MTTPFALLAGALVVFSTACSLAGGDSATVSPAPEVPASYRSYASQLCAAQAANLEDDLASVARLYDALESDSFEIRADAVDVLLDELSDHSIVFLAHLESVSPPETDDRFTERRRVSEREFAAVLAEVRPLAAAATTHEQLDAALETLIASFDVGFDAKDALAVASPELEAALRAEPACAPLF